MQGHRVRPPGLKKGSADGVWVRQAGGRCSALCLGMRGQLSHLDMGKLRQRAQRPVPPYLARRSVPLSAQPPCGPQGRSYQLCSEAAKGVAKLPGKGLGCVSGGGHSQTPQGRPVPGCSTGALGQHGLRLLVRYYYRHIPRGYGLFSVFSGHVGRVCGVASTQQPCATLRCVCQLTCAKGNTVSKLWPACDSPFSGATAHPAASCFQDLRVKAFKVQLLSLLLR